MEMLGLVFTEATENLAGWPDAQRLRRVYFVTRAFKAWAKDQESQTKQAFWLG